MDWISQQAATDLDRILESLRSRLGDHTDLTGEFQARLKDSFESLFRHTHQLYGWRYDFVWLLEDLIMVAAEAAGSRPERLLKRGSGDNRSWMQDSRTLWAMTYAERFAGDLPGVAKRVDYLASLGVTHLHLMPPYAAPIGQNDGGYAVSDYRRVRSDLGTIDDLTNLIDTLDQHGIRLVLDFVANHTADDHGWAEAAKEGDPFYQAFYFLYDDREMPDRFEPYLRDIFPDRGSDTFIWRPDVAGPNNGKWVWSTFYEFQWDLDYSNPQVLLAMAAELAFIVNLGAGVIRMDATPFLWKREGTTCENLPEAHVVLKILRLVATLVAPEVEFLSEAIVHPDEVVRFVAPDECRLGYNPLVMALTWEALATRRARFLADALDRRSRLVPGCQWITYLRSHDDIGWGFANEDAARLAIDPEAHREFLNAFYAGEHPESFARGIRFQVHPETGDARISGTLASLAGLEQALEDGDEDQVDLAVRRILAAQAVMLTSVGIPLLYLGDEIGQLNDYRYRDDPLLAGDNRWMHRPFFDWDLANQAGNGEGPQARILAGMRRLIELRKREPALGGGSPEVLATSAPSVLAYRRSDENTEIMVAVNLSERPAAGEIGLGEGWEDAFSQEPSHADTISLEPYEFRVLRRATS